MTNQEYVTMVDRITTSRITDTSKKSWYRANAGTPFDSDYDPDFCAEGETADQAAKNLEELIDARFDREAQSDWVDFCDNVKIS